LEYIRGNLTIFYQEVSPLQRIDCRNTAYQFSETQAKKGPAPKGAGRYCL